MPSFDDSKDDPNVGETASFQPAGTVHPHTTLPHNPESRTPSTLGRFRVDKLLGRGGFGEVYRAFDTDLQRTVAIKLIFRESMASWDQEEFLKEARILASLDHPHIVPIYEVGQSPDGDHFLVSKLIDGSDLSTRIKDERLERTIALEVVETIANALHHAHTKGLIHRDVKPANILLDRSGTPYLADFGIALREVDLGGEVQNSGTPAYMSPEQARGESHRVDHRSDIYSLGVVLYELLTGRRPFRTEDTMQLLSRIATEDVRTPRMFDHSIPSDLERICLKALSRRATDRYQVAKDLAEEIRWSLDNKAAENSAPEKARVASTASLAPATPSSSELARSISDSQRTRPTRVVPKGLRSFDAKDSDFFLELLPGPRDRDGLPDSIRFWKSRIEELDPQQCFSVGLIYGPSGCGKSSLIKAGLLPRLSPRILPVYVEASATDTEQRLIRGAKAAIPDAQGKTLHEMLASIRRHRLIPSGGKLLLVLDQFEQWLHSESDYAKASLTEALRQCDGVHIQAIVMVRDDFWLSVSRFLRELEVPILEGENSGLVDLFDKDHATKVLGLFGKAFGKLPDSTSEWTEDQKAFLSLAVTGLSQDGKVISVRLAVLADMMKSRDWTRAALKDVGGIDGIGVTFLEETFGSHAPPEHRPHREAVRGLLTALLPSAGTDIKGNMRTLVELQVAAGYENKRREFDELIQLLDRRLRLITPVDNDPKAVATITHADDTNSRSESRLAPAAQEYQLTHDYMVPSLRDWLTRKQRETRKGRAELKLAERAATWSVKRENNQLPTVSEWLSIRTLTHAKKWTESERAVMNRAGRVHGSRWGGLMLSTLILGFGIQQWISSERWRNLQDQTRAVAESLQNTLGPSVPVNLKELGNLPNELVVPELQCRYASATNPRHKLSLAFALAHYGKLDTDYLVSKVDDIADSDTGNFITAMQSNVSDALASIQAESAKCIDKSFWRRKAKFAIVALNLGDATLATDVCAIEVRPDPEQRTLFIDEFPRWENRLKEIHDLVTNSDSLALRSGVFLGVGQIAVAKLSDTDKECWRGLASRCFVEKGDTTTHSAAGWLLRRWGIAEPKAPESDKIVAQRDWFVNSVGATMLKIRAKSPVAVAMVDPLEKYRKQLADLSQLAADEMDKLENRMTRAEAHYQVGNIESAMEDFDWLLTQANSETLANTLMYRTLVLARLGKANEAKESLSKYLEQKIPKSYVPYMQIQLPAWLGDYAEATRQLELALGDSSNDADTLYNLACAASLCAKAAFATGPEQAKQFTVKAFDTLRELVKGGYKNKDQLYADPDFENLRKDERFTTLLDSRIAEFWVADREVSRGQFERFVNDATYPDKEKPERWVGVEKSISPTAEHPAQYLSWYDSVMYCNWLSLHEGRKPCYERTGTKTKEKDNDEEHDGWRLIPGGTGYRLLTDAEWEYACRAGTQTEFSMGSDETLLVNYCQMYPSNLAALTGEKIPNAWGLHDVHGNVWEWCEDLYDTTDSGRVFRGGGWYYGAINCRSAGRDWSYPSRRNYGYGFRVALSPSIN